jgi:hypothetical protein
VTLINGETFTKVLLPKVNNPDLGVMIGAMEEFIWESFGKIGDMEKERMNGAMELNM